MDTVTDWREEFRARPYTLLGAAFIGGVCLAAVLRPNSARRGFERVQQAGMGLVSRSAVIDTHGQARALWQNVTGALVGLAATRVRGFIAGLVPGFEEHYRRAEQWTGRPPSPSTGH